LCSLIVEDSPHLAGNFCFDRVWFDLVEKEARTGLELSIINQNTKTNIRR
jgi:hypothetical protein